MSHGYKEVEAATKPQFIAKQQKFLEKWKL